MISQTGKPGEGQGNLAVETIMLNGGRPIGSSAADRPSRTQRRYVEVFDGECKRTGDLIARTNSDPGTLAQAAGGRRGRWDATATALAGALGASGRAPGRLLAEASVDGIVTHGFSERDPGAMESTPQRERREPQRHGGVFRGQPVDMAQKKRRSQRLGERIHGALQATT